MDPMEAAAIVALRPAIENLILEATENPEAFFPLAPHNERLVSLIVNLSRLETPIFGEELEPMGSGQREGYRKLPPQNFGYAGFDGSEADG